MDMIHKHKTIEEIIADKDCCPFPISIIPDYMGINLSCVKGINWVAQTDGQLKSLTIDFYLIIQTLNQ